MKPKISRFTLQLIKKNAFFLFGIFFFTAIFVVFIPFQLKGYLQIKQEIEKEEEEVEKLVSNQQKIDAFETFDIDRLYSVVEEAVPSTEDGLNVLASLEYFSNQALRNNFFITSYSNPFTKSSEGVLSISIEGTGSVKSLAGLMQSLQTAGNRFITLDNVEITGTEANAVFALNYYSKKIPEMKGAKELFVSEDNIEAVRQVQNSLEKNYIPDPSLELDSNNQTYQTNPDPFGS